jgi:trimethylamine:corrinoid methyltransferase-like protein
VEVHEMTLSAAADTASRADGVTARLEVWDREACERVHDATLQLLDETGVEVRDAGTLALLRRAGASVDETRVRFNGELVETALSSAPKTWLVRSRGRDEVMVLRDATTERPRSHQVKHSDARDHAAD